MPARVCYVVCVARVVCSRTCVVLSQKVQLYHLIFEQVSERNTDYVSSYTEIFNDSSYYKQEKKNSA